MKRLDQLDDLELYYLRRTVMQRLDTLERNLTKNRRFFRDLDDDITYQRKIANLEIEMECLQNVRDCINVQIAFREFNVLPDTG